MDALDQYDADQLDDREYGLSIDARRAAEQAMEARDAARGLRAGLAEEDFGEGEDEETYQGRQRRMKRMRRAAGAAAGGAGEEEEEEGFAAFDIGTFDVPLREWIAQDQTRTEIKRRFRWFLDTYTDLAGTQVYERKIQELGARNEQSLEVSYLHLSQAVPLLAVWLADVPKEMLQIMNEVAHEAVLATFPDYDAIHDEIYVRISQLPIADSLRELRHVRAPCGGET